MKNKALFLDRDGTVNVEKNYVFRIEDFEFREGIFELVYDFFKRGYLIFVITNQAGIARGLYTHEAFQILNDWMVDQFSVHGITISGVFYCPHHPDFDGECDCRKPKPGMILKAKEQFNLELKNSFLIGDKISDIQAGLNAGIGTNYLIGEKGKVKLENVIIYKS
jgi:D-glycero-D-manno-heptose 1,7-bisphosphate phosphatase